LLSQLVSYANDHLSLKHVHTLIKQQNVFFSFSISSLMLSATSILSSLIVLRWVSPASMGVWQTLVLIQSYSDLARLGIVRGLNRELPYLLGRDEQEQAFAMVSTAQAYSLFVGILGFVGFVAVLFVSDLSSAEWRAGLLCMGILWFASSYGTYLQGTYRAQTEFKRLSSIQFLQAGLQLLSLLLVVLWGYTGMVARSALLALIMAALLHRYRPIRVRPWFRWPDFRALLSTGLPLYGSAYLYGLAMGFERVILLQKGGTETVGMYTPASAILTVMVTLPATLSLYIYPRMAFDLGKHDNPRHLWHISIRAVAASAALAVIIALAGWLALPLTMRHIFPQYLPALEPTRLALVAGVFLSVNAAQTSMAVLKAWRYLYLYMGLFALTKCVFPWLLAQWFEPLIGVAIGGVVASMVMVFVALWTSFKATHRAKTGSVSMEAGS
jgi:O-antigen/teichoic acid export membrane protein